MWIAVDAGRASIASWLEIVREVEPLFGAMPDFEATLTRNVDRGTAICVCDTSGQVLGGVLVGMQPPRITWLAVRASARGRRVGRVLLAEALRRFPPDEQVVVDTFGENNIEGRPARRLYESFGFVAAEHLEPGPEGGTRQCFRLHSLAVKGRGSPRSIC